MNDFDAIALFHQAVDWVETEYKDWPAEVYTYVIMAREIENICFEEGVALKVSFVADEKGVTFTSVLQPVVKNVKVNGIVE